MQFFTTIRDGSQWKRLAALLTKPRGTVLYDYTIYMLLGVAIGFFTGTFIMQWAFFTSTNHASIGAALVQVGGGSVAGLIAFIQFQKSHNQREEQFRKTELQNQFEDIQNRFASEGRCG